MRMYFDEFTATVLYRVSTIFVGGWIVFMGYRLFSVGVFQKATDLKAAWGDNHLELKQAAPGTIFALFGAAVLIFSIQKGISLEQSQSASFSGSATSEDMSELFATTYPEDIIELIFAIASGEELSDDDRSKLLNWSVEKKTTISAGSDSIPSQWNES